MMNREDAKARCDSRIERVAAKVIDAALAVHRELGPGLLESAYQATVAHELKLRGIDFEAQVVLPIRYRGITLDVGYRLDFVVEGCVVVELKTVSQLAPIHTAQLLSYLRVGDYRLGLLLNFHAPLLRDGLRRIVNGL